MLKSRDKVSQLLLAWKLFTIILKDIILSWQISLKFWGCHSLSYIFHNFCQKGNWVLLFFFEGNVPFSPLSACIFLFLFAFQQFVYVCFFILPLLRYNRQMKLYCISLILDTVFFILSNLEFKKNSWIFGLMYFIRFGSIGVSVSSNIASVPISSYLLLGFQSYMC